MERLLPIPPPPPGDKHKPDLHTENDFSKLVLLSDTHGQAGPDINSTEYVWTSFSCEIEKKI